MHGWLRGIVFILLFVSNGCIIVPVPSRTTAGHRYSKEALAFLDIPGMTKAEVVSTLGPPDANSREFGILAYKWEYVSQSQTLLYPEGLTWTGPGKTHETAWHGRALFIAFDATGIVKKHEVVRLLQANNLRAACEYWGKHEGQK